MTVADLNRADRERFVAAIGWVFEDSPWVAARAWDRRPFADVAALHAAMSAEVAAASDDERLALLRAHPDLGTRARMTAASAGEQAGAGLDAMAASDLARLERLTREYRERFGFPFLLAVRGRTAAQIVEALESRLPADPAAERDEALRQVHRIAELRLRDALGGGA
jgi:OHCU decarboxylase